MIKLDKEGIVKISVVVISVALISLGLVGALEPRPASKEIVSSSYSESLNLELKDLLLPNLLYGNVTLVDPSHVYTNITQNLSISADFTLSRTNSTTNSYTVTQSIVLVSQDPSWSKIVLVNVTSGTMSGKGFTTTIGVPANFPGYLNTTKAIDQQLGGAYSDPTVTFNITASVGSMESMTSSLTVLLSPVAYTVTYNNEPAVYQQVTNTSETSVHLILPVSTLESYLMIAAGLVVSGYFLYPLIPRNTNEMKRRLKERYDQIVEVSVAIDKDDAIRVRTRDDLFKLAELRELPIFLNRDLGVLFVEIDSKLYFIELDI